MPQINPPKYVRQILFGLQARGHLAVTGDDLLSLGLKGPELGEMLKFLLEYVMEYPDNNKREILLELAKYSEES